ncbi:MAG: hypothetical protein ACK4XK_07335 [Casimicrobiaceae bacterium]
MTPLLIADGRIATTAIVERLLRDAYDGVEVRTGEELVGVQLAQRPIYISRLCHPRYAWLPAHLASRGAPYVYLLDDDFFALDPGYDRANGAFFSHPEVHGSLTAFLRGARAVWVMSEILGERLRHRLPGLEVRYVPPPVDIALIDRARAEPPRKAAADAPFVVGYASSRRPNVAALLSAIVEGAAARFGQTVAFEFIGYCPDAVAMHPNVTAIAPIADYAAFMRTMLARGWSAALAPLADSAFENAKTNLKFREYGAAYLPGIYSRVPLYAACVRHEVTGLLVPNAAEAWLDAIAWLRADPARRLQLARQARAEVEHRHAQPRVAAQLRNTFADCWSPR